MAAVDAPTCFFVAVLAIIPVALYLLSKSRNKDGEAGGLPPGPRGLPLLGYLPFLDSDDPVRCFTDLAHTYGPVMALHLGSRRCVVLSSPAAAREVLRDQDIIFANHDAPASAIASVYAAQDLMFAPYGPLWRTFRKLSVRELLSPSNIEYQSSVRQREVGNMLNEIRRKAGEPLELAHLVSAVMMNSATMMMWGSRVAEEENELGREFTEVVDDISKALGEVNLSDFFPALSWLDLQGQGRRMRRLTARFDRIIETIVQKRLNAIKGSGVEEHTEPADKRRDFLQVVGDLLQNGNSDKAPLTTTQVKSLFLVLVGAGVDTTATTLEWAMAEMLYNPHTMAKAKEEIDAVVGKSGTAAVEDSHLQHLHYLDAVVKEVLRLHPVAPLLLPRRPSSTCTVSGYTIPEGTKVFINAWAIHRNPDLWEHATEFRPERFLSGNGGCKNIDYLGNNFHYIPFGGGRRICPGAALADRVIKLMLASLLHGFDWSLPDGVESDLSDKFTIVMRKKNPLLAVPTLRN